MIKIVVLNGSGRCGKDTFVKMVGKYFEGAVFAHSTVETVKQAGKLFGADERICKGEKERELWCALKDAYTRYNDGPFREIINKDEYLNNLFKGRKNALLFCMVREPPEIKKLVDHFEMRCMTILMTRSEGSQFSNHADANVAGYPYDIRIQNDGTLEELEGKARRFARLMNTEAKGFLRLKPWFVRSLYELFNQYNGGADVQNVENQQPEKTGLKEQQAETA